jgi:dolichol-phosphate mannosyltransferase
MYDISLILPTYNERENIEMLIKRIFSSIQNVEVIIVDDDSPDRTWAAAETLRKKYPSVKVHRRVNQRGLTSAIQAGIDTAEGKSVGWLDCDLSMPPELFKNMSEHLQFAHLVVGSRYIPGGRDKRPFRRRVFSRIINSFGQYLLGTKTSDLTSGFILCRRSLIDNHRLKGVYGEYCIDLIFSAERSGFKVMEIPYNFIDRQRGKSKTCENILDLYILGSRYVAMILKKFKEK